MENEEIIKRTAVYTIQLVASLFNEKKPPEKGPETTWEEIRDFAQKHSILNLVSYACENLDSPPPPAELAYLREFRKEKMVVEAQQQIETEDAMNLLEKNGIPHMALKGFIVKNMYPSPDMRVMSDVDILVSKEKIDDAEQLLMNDGFNKIGEGELHKNLVRGNVQLELHENLVNARYKKLYAYFKDGFSRAVLSDGCRFRYELSDEDTYLFLLTHLAKHYIYKGTGIRSVLDVFVYRRFCKDMDDDYIKAETEKLGIGTFAEKIEKLAFNWFSGSFDGEFDSIASYVIMSGTFGKKESIAVNSLVSRNYNEIGRGKSRRIREIVFPKPEIMAIRYPVLKKFPVLLPVFYIVRFFDTLFADRKIINQRVKEANDVLTVDEELITAFSDAGLDVF